MTRGSSRSNGATGVANSASGWRVLLAAAAVVALLAHFYAVSKDTASSPLVTSARTPEPASERSDHTEVAAPDEAHRPADPVVRSDASRDANIQDLEPPEKAKKDAAVDTAQDELDTLAQSSGEIQSDPIVLPAPGPRYLSYTVNAGEGFNLARDVFIRAAALVHHLNENCGNEHPCVTLVLPPFAHPHWTRGQTAEWDAFFDIAALNQTTPVMLWKDFVRQNGRRDVAVFDQIFHLETKMPENGQYIEVVTSISCPDPGTGFAYEGRMGRFQGWLANSEIEASVMECYRVFGESPVLSGSLRAKFDRDVRSILVTRFERLLHHRFGGRNYWRIRRSMQFAEVVKQTASDFVNNVIQGQFLAVHLRRGDFARFRTSEIPSVAQAAEQVRDTALNLGLNKVLVASDEPGTGLGIMEYVLREANMQVYRFPGGSTLSQAHNTTLLDGQVAAVDQWICVLAQKFVGTDQSTFTYRIREERDIRGLSVESTHQHMCPRAEDGSFPCLSDIKQRWAPVFD